MKHLPNPAFDKQLKEEHFKYSKTLHSSPYIFSHLLMPNQMLNLSKVILLIKSKYVIMKGNKRGILIYLRLKGSGMFIWSFGSECFGTNHAKMKLNVWEGGKESFYTFF